MPTHLDMFRDLSEVLDKLASYSMQTTEWLLYFAKAALLDDEVSMDDKLDVVGEVYRRLGCHRDVTIADVHRVNKTGSFAP